MPRPARPHAAVKGGIGFFSAGRGLNYCEKRDGLTCKQPSSAEEADSRPEVWMHQPLYPNQGTEFNHFNANTRSFSVTEDSKRLSSE